MEFKVNTLSVVEKEVEVTLNADEFTLELEKELIKLRKNIRVDGFRKGKVPKHLYDKLFGNSLDFDASENIANKVFWDIAKDNDIRPLNKPSLIKLDFTRETGMTYTVAFEVYPEIEVKEYTGLTVKAPGFKVTDELLEDVIKDELKRKAEHKSHDIIDGTDCEVVVDYTHVASDHGDGKPHTHSNMPIDLSAPSIDPKIVEVLLNHKVGDEVEYTVIDKHQHEGENGEKHDHEEEIKFLFKITSITKVVSPELNDEFVQKTTNFRMQNVAEWKDSLLNMVKEYHKQREEESIEMSLTDNVMKNNEFKLGEGMLEDALNQLVKAEKEKAKTEKRKVPTDEKLREQLLPSAESYLKWVVIKNKIIDNEKLTVSKNTLYAVAKKLMDRYGLTVEQATELVRTTPNLQEDLMNTELFKFLMKNNNILLSYPDNEEVTYVYQEEEMPVAAEAPLVTEAEVETKNTEE